MKKLIAAALIVCATIAVVAVAIVRHVNNTQDALWCHDHGYAHYATKDGFCVGTGGKLFKVREVPSPRRNAWVIGRSGINAALLSARHHRADFELAVRLPTLSDARSGKEGRVPIFEPNSERKRKADEDRKGEQRRSDRDVEQSLVLRSDYKAPCHRDSDSGAEKNKIFVLAAARAREIEIVASAI